MSENRVGISVTAHGGGDTIFGPRALDRQVGGDHYKNTRLQPLEVAWEWELDFPDGSMLKYLFRWAKKRNRQDLEKLRHWADLILEHIPAEETPKRM